MQINSLPEMRLKPPGVNAGVENVFNMAEKMALTELNIRRVHGTENKKTKEKKFSTLEQTLRYSINRMKNDLTAVDSVIRSRFIGQAVEKAAGELSETVAIYTDIFLNKPDFSLSFTDFYLRGIRRGAFKFHSVKKTLTELEHPLRLTGSYIDPLNYFQVFTGGVVPASKKTLSKKKSVEEILKSKVFSCIVKTDKVFINVVNLDGTLYAISNCARRPRIKFSRFPGKIVKIYGQFKNIETGPLYQKGF